LNAKKGKNRRYNQNEETALFASRFKGKCNNCGWYGRKLRDCRKKKKNKNNNRNYRSNKNKVDRRNRDKDNNKKPFPYKCHYYCQKEGHMAKDYFKKKRNERQMDKRANAQDKDDKVGFVMFGLVIPESINKWYAKNSVNILNNECMNESPLTREDLQRRINKLVDRYFGPYQDVVVNSDSSGDNKSLHTLLKDKDMSESYIRIETKSMERYQAIKKCGVARIRKKSTRNLSKGQQGNQRSK
jgi:hypothetical protein